MRQSSNKADAQLGEQVAAVRKEAETSLAKQHAQLQEAHARMSHTEEDTSALKAKIQQLVADLHKIDSSVSPLAELIKKNTAKIDEANHSHLCLPHLFTHTCTR